MTKNWKLSRTEIEAIVDGTFVQLMAEVTERTADGGAEAKGVRLGVATARRTTGQLISERLAANLIEGIPTPMPTREELLEAHRDSVKTLIDTQFAAADEKVREKVFAAMIKMQQIQSDATAKVLAESGFPDMNAPLETWRQIIAIVCDVAAETNQSIVAAAADPETWNEVTRRRYSRQEFEAFTEKLEANLTALYDDPEYIVAFMTPVLMALALLNDISAEEIEEMLADFAADVRENGVPEEMRGHMAAHFTASRAVTQAKIACLWPQPN